MDQRAPYQWGGKEWESYCLQLLIRRHVNSYARMPDTDAGDLGMEGYSTDGSRCAYQCYAPEAEETLKRAEAQIRKINRDLRKWKDRPTEVAAHLNGVVVSRWILLTPTHDSKAVTKHCRKKEQEMRLLDLEFLDRDFRVDVQTAEIHFTAERRLLEEEGVGVVKAPPADVQPEELERLAEERPDLLRNLEQKIERLLPSRSEQVRQGLREFMQHAAVDAANLEDHLRINHAPTYELFLRERDAEERAVQLESFTGASVQPTYVNTVRERYESRLRREVPGLRKGDEADRLSHGGVADWLRRCPMDFPTSAS
ncbi:hypothetical protein [Candidatus Solirubrobacter pratensis]|uniref:hypothetical protein n=1 Tax=Candidatus Solirubrobacter pratensis TaxID=1298857 RepID=UPI0004229B2F|nr:hypothetical protein [Candidatus Solirubrobacter pratensis]